MLYRDLFAGIEWNAFVAQSDADCWLAARKALWPDECSRCHETGVEIQGNVCGSCADDLRDEEVESHEGLQDHPDGH